jgi:addiction module HigA family antidote
MEKLNNIHPGEILREEFLKEFGISSYSLSKKIGVPQTRISEIINERRGITADTAIRLSAFFGNSSQFWLGLQNDFDLENAKDKYQTDYENISHYKPEQKGKNISVNENTPEYKKGSGD